MLFKEGNNPFAEVIQPPNSISHPVTVVRSNNSAAEKFLQCVEQLDIPLVLDDREFGEHLKLASHFWMWIDAGVKATCRQQIPQPIERLASQDASERKVSEGSPLRSLPCGLSPCPPDFDCSEQIGASTGRLCEEFPAYSSVLLRLANLTLGPL